MNETVLKPCPFCQEDNEGYTQAFGAFHLAWDKFDGWRLHAGKCKPKPINFCPICGNALRKEINK